MWGKPALTLGASSLNNHRGPRLAKYDHRLDLTDLTENSAPSPHGAVDMYRWKETLSFTDSLLLPDMRTNRLSVLPGSNVNRFLYRNLQIKPYFGEYSCYLSNQGFLLFREFSENFVILYKSYTFSTGTMTGIFS